MNTQHGAWRRGLLWAALTLLVGWNIAGCPLGATSDPTETTTTSQTGTGGMTTPQTVEVEMKSLAFSPSEVTIRVGASVRWVNSESARIIHNVVSGDPNAADAGQVFQSADLAPNESFTLQFTTAGTYKYHCTFHPTKMRDATVIVTE